MSPRKLLERSRKESQAPTNDGVHGQMALRFGRRRREMLPYRRGVPRARRPPIQDHLNTMAAPANCPGTIFTSIMPALLRSPNVTTSVDWAAAPSRRESRYVSR